MKVQIALAANENVTPEVAKHVSKVLGALGLLFPKARKFILGVDYVRSLTSEFDRDSRKLRISTAFTKGTVEQAQRECSKANKPGFTVHDGEHEAFDALIVHEFAHAVNATIAEHVEEDRFYEYKNELRSMQKKLGNPSEYAAKNDSEWMAERFTFEWMGKGNGPLIRLLLRYIE